MIGLDAGGGGWRIIGGICALSCGMALVGCGGARSVLRPLPETPSTVEIAPGLRLTVAAITAAPELGDDDVALLDRFYSALWVELRNDTTVPMTVDPEAAVVVDRTGTPWVALDGVQRRLALRWRPWSWGAWRAGWISAGHLEQLMTKLDRLQMGAGPMAVGETRRGVLIFKRIPAPECRRATLEWRAIREEEAVNSPAITMTRMAMGC